MHFKYLLTLGSLSAHKGLFRFTSLLDIISVIGSYRLLNVIFITKTQILFVAAGLFYRRIHTKTFQSAILTISLIIIVGKMNF